jgi:CHAT domain-containing protein
LQRAFQVAGARNLIMSLWKVDDAVTQKLMTSFFRHWLNGKSKAVAFAQAQKEIRAQHPEPYYWGAFVMLGK